MSFCGHETFPFRYAWLKKGLDAVISDPAVFNRDEAMTVLGVGKNMVRSIRHWCLAAGVIEEVTLPKSRTSQLQPTGIGIALFADDGWDPYLEDPATLWLLHWQLASTIRRASTWYWAFSHVHEPEFTKDALFSALSTWAVAAGVKRISPASLRRDIDCFLRTYVPSHKPATAVLEDTLDCPLAELGLIREAGERGLFQFNRGPKSELPDTVVLHAVLDFWDRSFPANNSMSLKDVAHRPGSPARLFQMDEHCLASRMEGAADLTQGAINFDDTAGLRQLYRRTDVSRFAMLEAYYGRPAVTLEAVA
jgi:hypothetical protein